MDADNESISITIKVNKNGVENDFKNSEQTANSKRWVEFDSKDSYLHSVFGPNINFLEAGITFRERVQRIIESNYFHIVVIILVLLDTVCVAGELIISLEKKEEALETAENIFKYMGLTILCLFLVEILTKLIFNTHHFLKSKLEIFDGIIVIISFALDVAFLDGEASPAIGLITLLRLWRIARIVNGKII